MSTTSRKARCRVLEDDINDSVEEELRAVFEDLGEDQLAEVIAFCWVGQGTYEAADWDEAMEEAQDLVGDGTEERDRRADGAADARLGARIRASPPSTSAATGSARSPSGRGTDRSRAAPTARRDSGAGRGRRSRAAAAGNLARAAASSARATFGGTLF